MYVFVCVITQLNHRGSLLLLQFFCVFHMLEKKERKKAYQFLYTSILVTFDLKTCSFSPENHASSRSKFSQII